jgi:hypothetical protein
MELTKKEIIWGILLFGTLIGLNETLLGSIHMQYKSVILSTITISFFAYARCTIPRIGTTLLVMAVAVLFKLTSLGVAFCKPTMVILLGMGFELFASLLIRQKKLSYLSFILSCVLTSIVVFIGFATFETYILKNHYWVWGKFSDYVFTKAPLTAAASALLGFPGVLIIKKWKLPVTILFFKKPVISQLILGVLIAGLWIAGYVTMYYFEYMPVVR